MGRGTGETRSASCRCRSGPGSASNRRPQWRANRAPAGASARRTPPGTPPAPPDETAPADRSPLGAPRHLIMEVLHTRSGGLMGDAGEGSIDAGARSQERMEELERERGQQNGKPVKNPEEVRALESLRLARTELERQLEATTNDRRRTQIQQAIEEIDRRMAATRGGS